MPPIEKLLIANRGEIAARVIRTAQELDIATVAVFSDPDAGAPHVLAADESVHLPGTAAADTYLRADLIIAAARQAGAGAIHPGYGFLSENAAFARACEQAGLVFVGPPAAAIEAVGSKIAAKDLMAKAGVPVLGGAPVSADADAGELAQAAAQTGYPVLVKAAFGGGGRGMRIAESADELAEAVISARREAAAAFGDGSIFLERYVPSPRHVEVQIFGDTRGSVVHLFERECSIQRRYQKIVEEAPSPAVSDALRAELGAAAVAAGQAIGYVGAGTVEFLLGPDGEFWFLEINTRLQVEHPVTELITGLDLVALQLRVAEGEPLPGEVTAAAISGHAIEVRLYAEDAAAGFRPASGTVHRFDIPALPGIRVDAGVMAGSVVGTAYDPMLAKVIAWGPTRDHARRALARALAQARLHGVTTNRDLLVGILREPQFAAGQTDTGYLTRHDPAALAGSAAGPDARPVHALAAALAAQARRRAEAPVLATLPSGWRNVPSGPQQTQFAVGGQGPGGQHAGGQHTEVRYRLHGGVLWAAVDGTELPGLVLWSQAPDRVDLEVAGIRRVITVDQAGEVYYADSALGSGVLTEVPRFPEPRAAAQAGSLLAPMPGTVITVAVGVGDQVSAGDPVVVLEAMKMEHTVAAPHDGMVTEVRTEAGQAVDTGAVLAVVAEPS
ncbi:MAG: acetyl/propionyl/methylcrotonyl-CoA carboxylase subunit alpha [Streptosporangiaceae bacterium]